MLALPRVLNVSRASGFILLLIVAHPNIAAAQTSTAAPPVSTLKLDTGKQIYEAGCVSCHGPDGAGQPQHLAGFEPPATFPDFTDCPTSTVEPDVQWRAIINHGGAARAFSQIMPSFKDLLTAGQIDKVIGYLRSLCSEPKWPPGDLNLPRPIVTEKAFPENETVVTASFNAEGAPGVSTAAIYEHRLGSSAMWEVQIPYEFTNDTENWSAAFGDLALGYKQKLFHSLDTGSIVSLGAELIAPTGSPERGTGGESTVFEAFGAYGQLFPGNSFLQLHTGVELPAHPDKVPRAYYLRTAIGKTFATWGGLGRRWTPMVEFVGDRELVSEATTNWDVIPEVQMPLSKRMHILASLGVKLPANNTADRPKQIMLYLLWDWMDGPLTQGW